MDEPKRLKRRQLDLHDHKILELSAQHPPLSDQEIGRIVGLSRSAIVRRKRRPEFQDAVKGSLRLAQDQLLGLMQRAVTEAGALLQDPDPRIRLAAASTILKFMPEPKIETALSPQITTFTVGFAE